MTWKDSLRKAICRRCEHNGTDYFTREQRFYPCLKKVVGKEVSLNQDERGTGSLVDQIKSATIRHGVELPDGWKPEVARQIRGGMVND